MYIHREYCDLGKKPFDHRGDVGLQGIQEIVLFTKHLIDGRMHCFGSGMTEEGDSETNESNIRGTQWIMNECLDFLIRQTEKEMQANK